MNSQKLLTPRREIEGILNLGWWSFFGKKEKMCYSCGLPITYVRVAS